MEEHNKENLSTGSFFSEIQIDLMRDAIKKILLKYDDLYGKKPKGLPNYARLTNEIQFLLRDLSDVERDGLPEEFRHIDDFDINPDKLRNFGKGNYNKDTGNYDRTRFDSDKKRMAIAIFLTHQTIQKKHSIDLTREQLGLSEVEHHIPVILSRYLNPSGHAGPFSSFSLCGSYVGKKMYRKRSKHLKIDVHYRIDDLVFYTELSEYDSPNLGGNPENVYIGHLFITIDQNIIFVGKDRDDKEYFYFLLSQAIHSPEFHDDGDEPEKVESIIFFEHTDPKSILNGNMDLNSLLIYSRDKIEPEIPSKLLSFRREEGY